MLDLCDDERQRRRRIYNAERMFECTGMAGLPANAPESARPPSPSSLCFGVGASNGRLDESCADPADILVVIAVQHRTAPIEPELRLISERSEWV